MKVINIAGKNYLTESTILQIPGRDSWVLLDTASQESLKELFDITLQAEVYENLKTIEKFMNIK